MKIKWCLVIPALFLVLNYFVPARGEGGLALSDRGSEAEREQGILDVFAFWGDTPKKGIRVSLEDEILGFTDESGHLRIELEPGTRVLSLTDLESSQHDEVQAEIVAHKNTQVIYSLEARVMTVLAPPASEVEEQGQGHKQSVTLQVVDAESGMPLSDVAVKYGADRIPFELSDSLGILEVSLPAGAQSLRLSRRGFRTELFTVQVKEGEKNHFSLELAPTSLELEEVTVLAPFVKGSLSSLVDLRRRSTEVTDVLGSEQMSKGGDSDAAASLRRVTGLTLVKGRYVYVRGLGERYSSVSLNRSNISSPEPSKKVVPLDMFPTSQIESMVIQKSYSPNLPGEFGGGAILLSSRTIPEEAEVRLSVGISLDDAVGADFKSYEGGSLDLWGVDDGARSLPPLLKEATQGGRRLIERNEIEKSGFTPQELSEIGQSLSTTYDLKPEVNAALPSLSASMGTPWETSFGRVGVLMTGLYNHGSDISERRSVDFAPGSEGSLEVSRDMNYQVFERETQVSGSLDLGVETHQGQKIRFNSMLLRHTTDTVQVRRGFNGDRDLETTEISWVERQIALGQISGEHKLFGEHLLEWRTAHSLAHRMNPDQRNYTYELESDGLRRLSVRADGNQRNFSELSETSQDHGLDWTSPVEFLGRKLKIQTGLAYQERQRDSETRRFAFLDRRSSSSDQSLLQKSPNQIFAAQNIGPEGFQLAEITRPTDSYLASQRVFGYYTNFEVELIKPLTLTMGWRAEESDQDVRTFDLFTGGASVAALETKDLLPAYSTTWKFSDKTLVRLGYSETLVRPDFKELSTSPYTDDELGREVEGNNALKGTVLKNVDARWERYFSGDDSISFGLFYKEFESPIEMIIKPGAVAIRSFENAKAAVNKGAEFEFRMGMGRVAPLLRRFTLGGNLALIESEIQLSEDNSGVQSSSSRPLQGQSPYVVNFYSEYENRRWGTRATLLYNVFGARIAEVATQGAPDVYEQPYHQLDFVARQRLSTKLHLGLRVRNILDSRSIFKQGSEVAMESRTGQSFAANVTMNF